MAVFIFIQEKQIEVRLTMHWKSAFISEFTITAKAFEEDSLNMIPNSFISHLHDFQHVLKKISKTEERCVEKQKSIVSILFMVSLFELLTHKPHEFGLFLICPLYQPHTFLHRL